MYIPHRPGGLMRCCTLTLAIAYEAAAPDESEGAKMPCRHCSSSMIFRDGAWEWDRSRANPHGVPVPPEAELA